MVWIYLLCTAVFPWVLPYPVVVPRRGSPNA